MEGQNVVYILHSLVEVQLSSGLSDIDSLVSFLKYSNTEKLAQNKILSRYKIEP